MSVDESADQETDAEAAVRSRVEAVYGPDGDGVIVLYRGPLVATTPESTVEVFGKVELRLTPQTSLSVSIPDELHHDFFAAREHPVFSLPDGAPLGSREFTDVNVTDDELSSTWTNAIEAGDPAAATTFVIHVNGELHGWIGAYDIEPEGRQSQHDWSLPGWALILAKVDQGDDGFTHVIVATPHESVDADAVGDLRSDLFALLSFIAGREIGIGPGCGVDADGTIVYVEWGAPRARYGRPALRWSTDYLFEATLDELSDNYATLLERPGLAPVVRRAIGFLHAGEARRSPTFGSRSHAPVWRCLLGGWSSRSRRSRPR